MLTRLPPPRTGLFERAGVADWNASLTENGLDSLRLTQLIKVHASQPGTLGPEFWMLNPTRKPTVEKLRKC